MLHACTLITASIAVHYPADGRVTPCWHNASLASLPFCDRKLDVGTRVKDLVSRFSLGEKIAQLGSGMDRRNNSGSNAVARLGVDLYQYHSEGLHGVRTACINFPGKRLHTTEFPQVVAMAATGNTSLVTTMASLMSDEARALNNIANGTVFAKGGGLNYWGPTMNIGRDPRWGRFQESISEDPWLNAAYSVSVVRGMQGADDGSGYVKIAACCKRASQLVSIRRPLGRRPLANATPLSRLAHPGVVGSKSRYADFYAYSLEDSDHFTRHNFSASVTARDLAETYLPAFQACAAAGVEQVMCSYNSVNGVPTCLDKYALTDVLRGDFGFRGMVVSDCDSIADAWIPRSGHGYAANASDATAQGVRAGTDMDCGVTYAAGALDAVESGALPLADLDSAVERSLAMRFRLGEFDPPSYVPYRDLDLYGPHTLDSQAHRATALQAAEEAIVLLKNDDDAQGGGSAFLPLQLSADRVLRVGVVGPTSHPTWPPDDKNDYCPAFSTSPLQGLKDAAARHRGQLAVLECADCCARQTKHEVPAKCYADRAAAFARSVDVVIVCLGGELGGEAHDWAAVLPAEQAAVAHAIVQANNRSVAVLIHGNPMAIDALASSYPAIVEAFEGGQSAGTALASMLLGESAVAPSGVLPWTVYPDHYTSLVPMDAMAMRAGPGRTYRFLTGATPTFPFGFGLSYSAFSLEWESTPTTPVTVSSVLDGLRFRVRVTNVGTRHSAKVVALYARVVPGDTAQDGADAGPIKQLFGMQKVALPPGGSGVVTIESNTLPSFCSFCAVSPSGEAKVRPGTLTVSVGDGGHGEKSDLLKVTLHVV